MYKKTVRPYQNAVFMGVYEIFFPSENGFVTFVGYSSNVQKSLCQNILDAKNGNLYESFPKEFYEKMKAHKKTVYDLSFKIHFIEAFSVVNFYKITSLTNQIFKARQKSNLCFALGKETPQKTEKRKTTAVYELFCPLENKVISYVGQSLDFENRLPEHFFGLKSQNKKESTSQKFLNILSNFGKSYYDIFFRLHYTGLVNIESKFELDFKESELIQENKANPNVICCNIKD